MKLFLDKSQQYAVSVNKDSRNYVLSEVYPEVQAAAEKDAQETEGGETSNRTVLDHFKSRFKQFDFMWRNNGLDADGKQWSVKDMYSVPDAPILMPKVVSQTVREAIEPLMIGTSLLQRINFSMGQTILLPAMSALSQAGLDIPEGGEYPEGKLTQGGAAMVANIGKSGIAVKITDEMVRYSQIDVINMHLRAAARCLARHKEVKIFNMVGQEGTVFYDNRNPQESVLGVTHGRGFNGAANGSVIADDVFDLWGHLLARGFMADTMLVHPLTYTMYLKDPNMRALFFQGGGGALFATYNPRQRMGGNPWAEAGGAGAMSAAGKVEDVLPDTAVELQNQNMTVAPELPGYLGVPMQVIVSPFVFYDPITKLTDIMLFERNELGVILVDEDPTTEEWDDPARDIRKIKIRERYALGMLHEGQAAALIRNAVNVDNMISSEPARPQMDIAALDKDGNPTGSGGLEEIDEREPIV